MFQVSIRITCIRSSICVFQCQVTTSETKFPRSVKGCTRKDKNENETVRGVLGVQQVVKGRIEIMGPGRIPKLL